MLTHPQIRSHLLAAVGRFETNCSHSGRIPAFQKEDQRLKFWNIPILPRSYLGLGAIPAA